MLKKALVKNGKVKPCLKSIDDICPCSKWTGEIQRQNGKLLALSCESRKMHKPPVK